MLCRRVSAADDRTKKVTSGNSTVSYDYAGTRLNKIIFGTGENSESYSFTYDSFGNVLSTKVGSIALSQSTYGANNGLLQKTQYGNGDSVRYVYNDEGAVSKTLIKPASGGETTQSTALYDSNGRLAVLSDKITNRRTYYTYDSLGRVLREQFANDSNGNYTGIAEYRYDVRNNLTKLALNFGGRSVSASYTNEKLLDSAGNVTGYTGDYEKGNLPTRFTMYPDRVVNYEYDRLDRITSRCFVNSGVPVYNSYQYYVRQNAPSESNVVYRTTQLIREIVDNTGYTYTYDDVGNILTVKTSQRLYPNTSKVEIGEHSDYRSYSYDNKYQLTRENNVTSGKTTVYSYDELGNITSKTEYPYTQGALGTALSTVNYTYSNDGKNGWNKLLTAVGNETVTYDAIGNPTSYLGASLSWFGRKLQSYEKGNTNVTYTYDAGGSRASKTVNGTKSEFVYLDGKLVYEKRGGDDIFYLYDSYGSLSNIRWYKSGASSPTNIYVITNRQGDVLGLYDYAGTRKVSYEYDAWGNTVSVTDTSQDNWSTLNPFRYRGYYFDTETGLYYLLSRYYDPAVGRFLNADGYISTGTGITGLNMFAYCNNNPVAFIDSTGTRRVGALEKYKDSGIGRGTYHLKHGAAKPYKEVGGGDFTSPNCYSFAIGSTTNEQPGKRSGRKVDKIYDVEDVGKSVEADLRCMGYTVRRISGPNDDVKANEFKIALRVGTKPYNKSKKYPKYDYHFMRQTNTGQWAEKHGTSGTSILWDAGMTPDDIPWTYNGEPYYDSPIIYYAVGE